MQWHYPPANQRFGRRTKSAHLPLMLWTNIIVLSLPWKHNILGNGLKAICTFTVASFSITVQEHFVNNIPYFIIVEVLQDSLTNGS